MPVPRLFDIINDYDKLQNMFAVFKLRTNREIETEIKGPVLTVNGKGDIRWQGRDFTMDELKRVVIELSDLSEATEVYLRLHQFAKATDTQITVNDDPLQTLVSAIHQGLDQKNPR